MAAASVLCAAAGSLPVLLAGRALQAAGGAAGLLAAFTLLDGAGRGRRLWVAAAVFGTAVGPALGGGLAEVLGLRGGFFAAGGRGGGGGGEGGGFGGGR